MISAPPVGMEYVRGSRIEIVASGPRPGSRPTSVPTVHPMAQYIRLCSVRACEKPNARLWMTSMSVQGQVHAEEFREHERHQAQADGDLDVALPGVVLAGDGGDEHHHDDRDEHVDQERDHRER